MRLSRNSIASDRIYPTTNLKCVFVEIQVHLIENNLRQYQIVSELKFNCISSIFFYSNSIMRLRRNSMASDWNCSKTIQNCVWAGIQLHVIEFLLRQFRILSLLESQSISSNLFNDNFELCPSLNSIASYRKLSKTIPTCVWAETQSHLIEIILKQFHNASNRNSMASDWNCSKTIPICFWAGIQLHLIEILLRQFRIVS